MIGSNTTLEELETDVLECITEWYARPMRKDPHGNPAVPIFSALQAKYGRQGFGQVTMNLANHANVILWRNLSQPLAQAITNLLAEGKIHWHVSWLWGYMVVGPPLPLPLARWPITEQYNKPHWLPVEFVPGPSCDNDIGCPNYTGTEGEERFERGD